MKRLFTILLLLALIPIVNAEQFKTDSFEINIPEGYKLTKQTDFIYKWDKDNNYIAITLSSNENLKYNIKYYSKDDIDNQKAYLENNINKQLADYNIRVTVTNIEKKNIDDLYYLECDLYYPSVDKTGYNIYQKQRLYSTNNYLLTLVYNSDQEITDEDYSLIADTLKINDKTIDQHIKFILVSILVIGATLAVISYIIGEKKKKKKKA